MLINVENSSFDEVEPDPSLATLRKSISIGTKHSVTGVIGFGGGSSMDVAKLVSLIIGSKENIDDIYKKLNLYKLRSKVEILNLSNEFVVASLSKEKFLEIENSKDKEGSTIKFREDHIFLDPRSKELGARLIINLEKLYLSLKKLGLEVSEVHEYYNHSYHLGIPQIDTKYLQDKIFGIECNFEELNGIDFRKGCYVGQENTARIKLKDKLNKRLFAIKVLEGQINSEEISFQNKNIGRLLINNKYPFALFKLENKKFDFDIDLKCGDAKIKALKPYWF